MRRAIIHIGTPRTGTTSVQSFLAEHREEFAAVGVLYPDLTPRSASSPHLSHQHLGEALDGRRPRREKTELLERLDGALARTAADIAILSYEGFCLLPPSHDAADLLRAIFARHGFNMEVLLTVKAQELYAQSQYTWRCQFLRERRYFGDALPRILNDSRFDYNACLRAWPPVANRVVYAVPVHDHHSPAPLITRIFTALDLADRVGAMATAADLARHENRSQDPASIEVARRLTEAHGVSRTNAEARIITDVIAEEARARGFDSTPFQGLDAATAEKVISKFAASNDLFARDVWGARWSQKIAAIPLPPVNELIPARLNRAIAVELDDITRVIQTRFGISGRTSVHPIARALTRLFKTS